MPSTLFSRDKQFDALRNTDEFDVAIVGGGATGAGIAVDAASRGYKVALVEQHDFGKGTSSRSTKLIHGGVRYLQQGNIRLVRDSLRERGLLHRLAPHLVYKLPTIVPLYAWYEGPYYWAGLKTYDLLAGKLGFGKSKWLGKKKTLEKLPTLLATGLRGGIQYFDAGFDDARLLVNLIQTAIEQGATCVNYVRAAGMIHTGDRVTGVTCCDQESGDEFEVRAKVVVNAAGPFSDSVRQLDDPEVEPQIAPSQGVHVVLDRAFLPGDTALLVPKTDDGRVMFAIPWNGHTLVGTTDTERDEVPLEPVALEGEVEFILETAAGYLASRPLRSDVLAVFAGLRPLVDTNPDKATSKLGRDHQVQIDASGLVNVLGGKWTTYRKMAEDCVNQAAEVAGLPKSPCKTIDLPIHGAHDPTGDRYSQYGSDAAALEELERNQPELGEPLDAALPYTATEVVWAIRHEMARTVEDILTRRLRALMLNSGAALRIAPKVAEILAAELGHDSAWQRAEFSRFEEVARCYLGTHQAEPTEDSMMEEYLDDDE